ncbi:hypothetical protein Ddc_13254 [Ditylenchus destructor]|nr:hypothetical protein Ddc_13254 [Ditylenchus destructor]
MAAIKANLFTWFQSTSNKGTDVGGPLKRGTVRTLSILTSFRLTSDVKAYAVPRITNEILSDVIRFCSRKTLVEQVCPVNKHYFQLCLRNVPTLFIISKLFVVDNIRYSLNQYLYPKLELEVYPNDSKDRSQSKLGVKFDSTVANFIRFKEVRINSGFFGSEVAAFFRRHRESFSECTSLEVGDSTFKDASDFVPPQFNSEIYSLISDVFANCPLIRMANTCYSPSQGHFSQNMIETICIDQKLASFDDKAAIRSRIEEMSSFYVNYLFNSPKARLNFVNFGVKLFIDNIIEEIVERFLGSSKDADFCVTLMAKTFELKHLQEFEEENSRTNCRLSLFPYKPSRGSEFRLWCRKITRDDIVLLTEMDGTLEMTTLAFSDDEDYAPYFHY